MPPESSLRSPVPPPAGSPSNHTPLSLFSAGIFAVLVIVAGYYFLHNGTHSLGGETATACPTPPKDIALTASLSSSLSQVAAGATISISGTVQNQSEVPVSNATLYVKILRQDGGKTYPVDFFPLDGAVSLPAEGSVPVSFAWKAPSDTVNGQYVAGLALLSADGSLEAGTPAPDGRYFASYPFMVTAGVDAGTAFDPTSLLVNGAAVPPSLPVYVDGTGPTRIDLSADNGSGLGVKSSLTWTLYEGILPVGTPLSATSTIFKVQPKSSAQATFLSQAHVYPEYYLLGSFTTKNGAKSIVGLRLLNGAFVDQCGSVATSSTP